MGGWEGAEQGGAREEASWQDQLKPSAKGWGLGPRRDEEE